MISQPDWDSARLTRTVKDRQKYHSTLGLRVIQKKKKKSCYTGGSYEQCQSMCVENSVARFLKNKSFRGCVVGDHSLSLAVIVDADAELDSSMRARDTSIFAETETGASRFERARE